MGMTDHHEKLGPKVKRFVAELMHGKFQPGSRLLLIPAGQYAAMIAHQHQAYVVNFCPTCGRALATGGTILGPGAGSNDSIPIRISGCGDVT